MSQSFLYATAWAPFGRILGTLADVPGDRRERCGVAAICIGVGQGLAMAMENLEAMR